MATPAEAQAMRRAIALASRALGDTSPNPVVGCVIRAAAGHPVGEGHHARAGGPHAEVAALADAGERARGGTAVVTLEPCSHTGRTAPRVRALAAAGVARVVYAVADPTPAAGGGAAALAAAGIEAEGGLLAAEAAAGNEPWLTSVLRGRPYVLWKYAATLDGRSAAADGTSRWITSPAARADVHRLRAEADAVVVGSGTLRADDPQLAVRGARAEAGATQPLRVVTDTEAGVLTPGARILDGAAPTLVAVADDAADAAVDRLTAVLAAAADGSGHRADVVRLPRAAGGRGLDVAALLAALYGRDVRSVLLEGGPTLAGAFLAAGRGDRVVCYLAPVLLGAGPAALADAGIGTIGEALRLDVTAVDHLGPDLRLTAVPGPAPEPPAIKES
ncbi:bifunctional diaminohydroxyphosphoribosylaminopyrimidine deaminase/5-amino-6-(5-phosphoribosylamino)uracil reductase RibD [Streptomyces aculeolatus]